ncbi:Gmad2 immunoglobulin-like domain-containing protein [Desulfofalx alkaliphila]|uniref:Gmad2 immunoglobulin-like domain-containing protein n=1 Tax=Desulfofalx alkaliphila TaxID=105483 RepID=UPI0004E0CCD5|nr:Gmad2 immunoglobulin-like domain-containing protein [Desulfofalx alkaliphila]
MRIKAIMLALVAVLLLLHGCAKQEPQQKPETIVVPEVSSISFDIIELDQAPHVVRRMVKDMKDQEFATWAVVDGTAYIVLVPGATGDNMKVEIDEIEQRVPEENYSWLNVSIKYMANEEDEAEPVVAKFDLKKTPKAVGFQTDRVDAILAPTPRNPKQAAASQQQEQKSLEEGKEDKIRPTSIRITRPTGGEVVSSPVQITGRVDGINGELRARLKNSSGLVLAEKPVKVTDSEFEVSLSFSVSQKEQGLVEVFQIHPQEDTVLSKTAVSVTIQP